jgi:hypothetical protein
MCRHSPDFIWERGFFMSGCMTVRHNNLKPQFEDHGTKKSDSENVKPSKSMMPMI